MKRSNGKIYTAVTGGIGSGKSAVMRFIAELGYPVLSADAAARNIYDDAGVSAQMQRDFADCFTAGKPDRKKIAAVVFNNRQRLQKLNGITHPAIMSRLFMQAEREKSRFVFFEIPLLFEGGYEKDFDHVIVVLRNEKSRIASVVRRDGITESEVEDRIKNQFDYEKNAFSGHTVIYNDGDLPALYDKVSEAVHEIVSQKN